MNIQISLTNKVDRLILSEPHSGDTLCWSSFCFSCAAQRSFLNITGDVRFSAIHFCEQALVMFREDRHVPLGQLEVEIMLQCAIGHA